MEKLSIILPVYNGEKRLEKNLGSILGQDYPVLELLIINDGSTDSSAQIIEDIIGHASDKGTMEIRYIKQQNCGVAATRNKGIHMATGSYITFVDQDDYMEHDYCSRMMREAVQKSVDILVSGYVRVDDKGQELYRQHLLENEWAPYIVVAPWAHIYRTDFLRDKNLQFLSTGIGEDVYFNILAYLSTNKLAVFSYEGYNWVNNPQSVSNTRQVTISKKADPFILLEQLEQAFMERQIKITEYREYYMTRYIVWYMLYTIKGSPWKDVKAMADKLFDWLDLHYPAYRKNPNVSFRKPKGDEMVNRWSVWVLVRARQLHIDKLVLRMLSWIL